MEAARALLRSQLECPVCFTVTPGGRIFQCANGHSLCEECKDRVGDLCPQGRCSFGDPPVRNLAMENLIREMGFGRVCDNPGCEEAFEEADKLRVRIEHAAAQ